MSIGYWDCTFWIWFTDLVNCLYSTEIACFGPDLIKYTTRPDYVYNYATGIACFGPDLIKYTTRPDYVYNYATGIACFGPGLVD